MKLGDAALEGYLQELFNFTMESYKTGNKSIIFNASCLNYVWQRILQEGISLSVSSQNKIELLILTVIQTYLEENLKLLGLNFGKMPLH